MLRIRLRRVGLKKQPQYRMVIAENEWPRDGRFLEIVGRYNPRTNPETIEVNEERMYHWLKNGALPTESVAKLLTKQGVYAENLRGGMLAWGRAGLPVRTGSGNGAQRKRPAKKRRR